jgi:hypothetical protein
VGRALGGGGEAPESGALSEPTRDERAARARPQTGRAALPARPDAQAASATARGLTLAGLCAAGRAIQATHLAAIGVEATSEGAAAVAVGTAARKPGIQHAEPHSGRS